MATLFLRNKTIAPSIIVWEQKPQLGERHRDKSTEVRQTATCVPTSTTRPVGIWKKSVASLADRASPMKSRSCQPGMPECGEGFSERRERKNDVDMMSNCSPFLRATASAFGTFGDSMKPKRSETRVKRSETGVISTRSSSSV